MSFVDEITLHLSAGKGGNGVVRWRREKNRDRGGPSGGDGGKGGNVYAKSVRDISVLARYRSAKSFGAEDGGSGKSDEMHGKNGSNLLLAVPVGSVLLNRDTDERFELLREGEQVLLLAGGAGGLGNAHFKRSTNQRPRESTLGARGEEADFDIELQLIADVGLIGLPNAGKSSVLNALTRAHARIGSYAFTTLEPNLGVMAGNLVLADIPGLIEGAAEGKGLGHKFLRHIRRTKILIHCISLEEKDMPVAYQTIRQELERFDPSLLAKPEVVLLTKTDLISPEEARAKAATLDLAKDSILFVSTYDPDSVSSLSRSLSKILHTFTKESQL